MKTGYHAGKLHFGPTEQIGKRIKKARRWYGLSRPELALLAQVSEGTLSRIENGEDFMISTLMLVSQGLDIPLERFVTNLPELRR